MVVVANSSAPRLFSAARSNTAAPSTFDALICPVIVKTISSEGVSRPDAWAVPATHSIAIKPVWTICHTRYSIYSLLINMRTQSHNPSHTDRETRRGIGVYTLV